MYSSKVDCIEWSQLHPYKFGNEGPLRGLSPTTGTFVAKLQVSGKIWKELGKRHRIPNEPKYNWGLMRFCTGAAGTQPRSIWVCSTTGGPPLPNRIPGIVLKVYKGFRRAFGCEETSQSANTSTSRAFIPKGLPLLTNPWLIPCSH